MINYLNNNIENIILILIISIIVVIIYDLIKNKGKLYFNIIKFKINIQNKDTWSTNIEEISDITKSIDLDFKLELYNHKNRYNSIYEIKATKKNKFKYENLENPYLNLSNTLKTMSGSTTFEKLKYMNFLPFEVKTFNIKIKINKDEFLNRKKSPLYITYKEGTKVKKIKLNKYLRKKK